MAILTLLTTIVALLTCFFLPKKYLGVTTALPANPLTGDKARIFHANIEALYAEIGATEELDKVEGTSKLDTLYLAVAKAFHLASYYGLDTAALDATDKAALELQRNTDISRSGYGELKIKVWDQNNAMAAGLANALMQVLNDIHRQLQTENNRLVLQGLKDEYRQQLATLTPPEVQLTKDSASRIAGDRFSAAPESAAAAGRLSQYRQLINEYELALKTNPNILLVVERARPSPWADKPRTAQLVLFAFLGSLLFAVLLAFFLEGRNAQP